MFWHVSVRLSVHTGGLPHLDPILLPTTGLMSFPGGGGNPSRSGPRTGWTGGCHGYPHMAEQQEHLHLALTQDDFLVFPKEQTWTLFSHPMLRRTPQRSGTPSLDLPSTRHPFAQWSKRSTQSLFSGCHPLPNWLDGCDYHTWSSSEKPSYVLQHSRSDLGVISFLFHARNLTGIWVATSWQFVDGVCFHVNCFGFFPTIFICTGGGWCSFHSCVIMFTGGGGGGFFIPWCVGSGKQGATSLLKDPGEDKPSLQTGQSGITRPVTDLGGARPLWHLLTQNFFIFMQFSEKNWLNNRLAPPLELAPPVPFPSPRLNPFWVQVKSVKPGLHVTSAFAFLFYLWHHVLENANVKCKHHQLLL